MGSTDDRRSGVGKRLHVPNILSGDPLNKNPVERHVRDLSKFIENNVVSSVGSVVRAPWSGSGSQYRSEYLILQLFVF